MSFTIFDIIALTIIALSSISGLYRGFIRVVLGFAGFFLSIVGAAALTPFCKGFLAGYISHDVLLSLTSIIISYIFSLLVVSFTTSMLCKLLEPLTIGPIPDKLLGVIAGFVRGNIIVVILFALIAVFTTGSYIKAKSLDDIVKATDKNKYPDWLINSLTVDYFDDLTHQIIELVPKRLLQSISMPQDIETPDAQDVLENMGQSINPNEGNPLNDDLGSQLKEMLPGKDDTP